MRQARNESENVRDWPIKNLAVELSYECGSRKLWINAVRECFEILDG